MLSPDWELTYDLPVNYQSVPSVGRSIPICSVSSCSISSSVIYALVLFSFFSVRWVLTHFNVSLTDYWIFPLASVKFLPYTRNPIWDLSSLLSWFLRPLARCAQSACLRRRGDLSKNVCLELWSMYFVYVVDVLLFLLWFDMMLCDFRWFQMITPG